eukprot:GHRR01034092.1.p1 GENE.GHRR01034092.1~~GHRR01034092.1.p1  ORF type:complete len:149 (+),score=39.04 GHRR01034092.1:600-1046(+)
MRSGGRRQRAVRVQCNNYLLWPGENAACRKQAGHMIAALGGLSGYTVLHCDWVTAQAACCVLLQTGAGKTFTMSGDAHNYAHRGVIPRALHHVFREIDLRTDRLYKVHVSYMEIYNEALYDLLSDKPAASDSLSVLDDASNTVVSQRA